MSVKNQQEKVKDVLAMCEMHWLMNRIPEDKVLEMSDELEQHLREAVRDGNPVEAVVGPDEFTFAESWAEEARPSMWLRTRIVEFSYLLSALVATGATVYHVIEWTLFISVYWFAVLLLLIYSVYFSRPALKPTPRGEPWWKGWLVAGIAAVATVGAAWGLSVLTLGSRNAVLLEWPWYATLLAIGAALVLSRFRDRASSREERGSA